MNRRFIPIALACLSPFALFAAAQAQEHVESEALIDALVRKKILSSAEAADIRADMVKSEAASSAQKIRLGKAVSELSLYGDVRLRYQYDNLDPQLAPNGPVHGEQRSRWRFRLRLNADFKLNDNWFGGVQIQTNNQSDSGFQTYSGGFQNYGIYVSRAFVGWNATDWATLTAGKQPNPFYTTELVWDADINPSGMAETIRFHKISGREAASSSLKDGKGAVSATASPHKSERPWELTFIAGQFIFDDNDENLFDNDASTDAYLFEEQLLFRYELNDAVKFTVGPAYLTYTAAKVTGALNTQPFTSETDNLPPGVGETRDLSLLLLPGEVALKLAGREIKLLWDASYNTAGGKRTREIYGIRDHDRRDDVAFLAGFQIGENRKEGDWSLFANYRQIGLAAVDPNLNDSDWGLSRLNLRGWKTGIAYNFTDAVLGALTYSTAWNLRRNLIGGEATTGASLADANATQVLQLDLNVKF